MQSCIIFHAPFYGAVTGLRLKAQSLAASDKIFYLVAKAMGTVFILQYLVTLSSNFWSIFQEKVTHKCWNFYSVPSTCKSDGYGVYSAVLGHSLIPFLEFFKEKNHS